MSEVAIQQALIDQFRAAAIISDDYIVWPNTYGERFPDDQQWIRLNMLRADTATYSQDTNEHPGIFQIDVNMPLNTGTLTGLTLCDTIRAAFPPGTVLTEAGVNVTIGNTSTVDFGRVERHYRHIVSVGYVAHIDR